jgi:hypothetical protein
LLQTVTPIDHFPLSFLRLRAIDPHAVAIKQQDSVTAMSCRGAPEGTLSMQYQWVADPLMRAPASSPTEALLYSFVKARAWSISRFCAAEEGCAQKSCCLRHVVVGMSDLAAAEK